MANPSIPTPIVNQNVSVSDPNTPANQVKVNNDGSINITGSISASNPSVGTTGSAVPGSGTYLAGNQAGNLVGLSLDGSGNLKTSGSFTATDMLNKTGSVTSATTLFTQADCTGYYSVSAQITSVGSGNTIVSEISNDGTIWVAVNDQLSGAASVTAVGEYVYLCSAKQFRMRVSVYSSGTVTVNANLRGEIYQQNINATDNLTQVAGSAINTGHGTAAGSIRVELPTDGTGTVTANAGTNLNTSLLALESGGNLATVAGAVTASVVQSNTKQINGVATSTGTGAVGTGSQRVAVGTDTATIAGSAPGTAGTASAQVVTVQGIASMTKLLVTPDSVALPANQSVNVAQVNGTTTQVNAGAVGTGSQRVAVAQDTTTIAGSAVGTAGTASSNVVTVQGVASMTKLLVTPDSVALPANQSVNVNQFGGTNVVTGGTAGLVGVGGPTASGSSVTGNPVQIGGRGATANPSAVSDGQAVETMHDKLGKLISIGAIRTLKGVQDTTITASTAETTIITAIASTFADLYGLILANSSASATQVTIKDSTGGTTRAVFYVPAGDTRGFMLPVDSGIPQATVNNNWTATCGTSVSSLFVTALYIQNT